MSVLPHGRKAEQFARLLDGAPDRGDAADDVTLGPLVALAEQLRALPVGPDPDFRAALRQRLVAVAAVGPEVAPAPRRALAPQLGWQGRRRLAFAGAALAAVFVVFGLGVEGSRALPGDGLYPIKQVAESTQLALAHGDLARGQRHLEFAATRLDEVRALLGRHSRSADGEVAPTLAAMSAQTLAASRDLTRAARDSGHVAPLQLLAAFASTQQAELRSLLPALPPAALGQAHQTMDLLATVDTRATTLAAMSGCADCASAGQSDPLGVVPCSTCRAPASPATGKVSAATTTTTPAPSPGAGGSGAGESRGVTSAPPATRPGLPGLTLPVTPPPVGSQTSAPPGNGGVTSAPAPLPTLPLPLPSVSVSPAPLPGVQATIPPLLH